MTKLVVIGLIDIELLDFGLVFQAFKLSNCIQ